MESPALSLFYSTRSSASFPEPQVLTDTVRPPRDKRSSLRVYESKPMDDNPNLDPAENNPYAIGTQAPPPIVVYLRPRFALFSAMRNSLRGRASRRVYWRFQTARCLATLIALAIAVWAARRVGWTGDASQLAPWLALSASLLALLPVGGSIYAFCVATAATDAKCVEHWSWLVLIIAIMVGTWFSIAISVRRFRDAGSTGRRFALFLLVPVFALFVLGASPALSRLELTFVATPFIVAAAFFWRIVARPSNDEARDPETMETTES